MSVCPLRLNRVAADVRDAFQLKRLGAPKGTILEYTVNGIAYERDIYEPGVFDLTN